jgi:peptidoglycan/xylan/chitin deacetylase (PgdA/CDA1 family)/SAM-dependent methyltransferase
LRKLAPRWRHWARWCLDRTDLIGAFAAHVDQVSFALAVRELDARVTLLDLSWNYPIHIGTTVKLPHLSPNVLHYHREMTPHMGVKFTEIETVDRAIDSLNTSIASFIRKRLINSIFWDFRYAMAPELGSGVGSRGEHLEYKRELLARLLRNCPNASVVDVGCGELEVTRDLPVGDYTGLDVSEAALRLAEQKRPDWKFQLMQAEDPIPAADVVICLDVLIHQADQRALFSLVVRLAAASRRRLLVSGYEEPPTFTSELTRYFEPLSQVLRRTGAFADIEAVGRYRDTTVFAASKAVVEPRARPSASGAAKVIVASGWWCDTSMHDWALGSPATRSPAFFDLWYRQVVRCLNPARVVVTDSASPLKPNIHAHRLLQWVELDRNYGHANDIRIGRINTKYSGFTRSVLNGAMFALCCDADIFVYVEQDCLVWGEDFLRVAVAASQAEIFMGPPAENARGLHGNAAAPMLQQSLIVVRRSGLERFLSGILEAPWTDGEVSPEETMRTMLQPYELLQVPYGRSRPIDFDRSHFYVQHLDDDELARILNKLGTAGGAGFEILSRQIPNQAVPTHRSSSSKDQRASPPSPAGGGVEHRERDFRSPVSFSTIYNRVGTSEHWDRFFATPDPWGYSTEYEVVKRSHTLSAIPPDGSERALELACAEGHFTGLLAQRVGMLVASDISAVALERAARRCYGKDNITFQKLDLVRDPIPGQFDLIVCSEVLYYLGTIERLQAVMKKLVEALAPGGLLVTTHANLVSDDPDQTGFDWADHSFGAKTIGDVASQLEGLKLEWELRTPLYRVQRFRLGCSGAAERSPLVLELPLSMPFERRLERGIVWDGAIRTREAALRVEKTATIPILCYHRIAENGPEALTPYRIHPRAFEQQVRWLRRHGYYSVSIAHWADAMQQNAPLPGRPVLFTFDDGYRDFVEVAWPVLDRHGFSALVFIVAEKVGTCADWDVTFGEPAPLMSWEELRELARNGVDFGSHSMSHRRLDSLPIKEVWDECGRSRSVLEAKLERKISAFSYPWGAHNENVRHSVAECGYTIGLTTRPGFSLLTDDPLALPRIQIFGDCSLRKFASQLEAGLCMAARADVSSFADPLR